MLVLVDPDAPSRTNPRKRFWRHWLVTDIPVSACAGVPQHWGVLGAAGPDGGVPIAPGAVNRSGAGAMGTVLGGEVGECFRRLNRARLVQKYCWGFFFFLLLRKR